MINSDPAKDSPLKGFIVGHSTMDLDCLGSIALARYLYPDYRVIKSRRIHPLALQMYRLFQDHLQLEDWAGLDLKSAGHGVIVDTRSFRQIQEYFPKPSDLPAHVTVYDHHGEEESDIPHTESIYRPLGANTSILCRLLMDKKMPIAREDATLALAGVVADTGSFSHANVTTHDFAAAMWLLDQGADLALARKMTHCLFDTQLDGILHDLVGTVESRTVNGQLVLTAELSLAHQVSGLSLVVEKLADFEEADALFCVFDLEKEKSHVIIARSSRSDVDVAWILSYFGGGGHPQAGAALLRKSDGVPVMKHLLGVLETRLKPTLTASQIMIPAKLALHEDWTILQASVELENENLTALPICSPEGKLQGILSLKDIQKARKAQAMHAPVKAYMTRNVVFFPPKAGLREMERLFLKSDFSLIPVCDDGRVLGLVTRHIFLGLLQTSGQSPA